MHASRNPSAISSTRTSDLAQREEVASQVRLLEAWIETQLEYRGLPGLSLGIVHDQELVWARGFGLADREKGTPSAPDTVYRIASISKLFTSTAIMQLRDAGRLSLEDPLEKHLPWFRIGRPEEAPEPITIRHLLTHTAGLPREAPFPYWTDLRFPSSEEVREAVPGQENPYPPDVKWKYSNLGFTLAGEIVTAVAGEPYSDYVQQWILNPLGMESTAVGVPDTLRSRLATGYGRRMPDGSRALRPFTDARGVDPAAGLASTVEDLARFASLQFRDCPAGGRQILKGTTLREMHRVHWLRPDWQGGWGLGFAVLHTPERDLVRHGGWVAGYQSEFVFSPKEKVAVIALTNADDGQPYSRVPASVTDRAFQWLAPTLVRATAPQTEPARFDPAWEKYVGRYRNPWSDTQVLVMDGKLVAIAPTEVDPVGTRVTLVPKGQHTFRTQSEGAFVEDGDTVVFEIGADGRVARMKWGENFKQPVP